MTILILDIFIPSSIISIGVVATYYQKQKHMQVIYNFYAFLLYHDKMQELYVGLALIKHLCE